ncbi:MAG: hypothetical protein R6V83_01875 [Candidatus Thorarchaeota archaeon]
MHEEYKKLLDNLIRSVSSNKLDEFIEDGENIVLEGDYGRISLTRKGDEVRAKSVSGIDSEGRYRLDKSVLSDTSD